MQLVAGVSVVVLGYALYQHFKGKLPGLGGAAGSAWGKNSFGEIPFLKNDPTDPYQGYGYDPNNPGELLLLKDLIPGTIADYYAGQRAGDAIPSVSDLFDSVLSETYGSKSRPGDFMRVGYW